MKIAERFYSIQGEGRYAGTPAYFVRLSGCNFLCNWLKQDGTREFCDTVKVWQQTKEEISSFELAQAIEAELSKLTDRIFDVHIVITGGEPALQADEVITLADELHSLNFLTIELETNGSASNYTLYNAVDHINWSPKFKSAGYGFDYYEKIGAMKFWKENMEKLRPDLKVVIASKEDETELERWLTTFHNRDFFLMPVSNTREEHQVNSEKLVQLCMRLGLNYSPRLQLMIWDKTCGV